MEEALRPLSELGGRGLVQVGIEGRRHGSKRLEEGPVREPCDAGRSRRAWLAPPGTCPTLRLRQGPGWSHSLGFGLGLALEASKGNTPEKASCHLSWDPPRG